MPSSPPSGGPGGHWAPFACRWRLDGRDAASVEVSGEVDVATARRLAEALRGATGAARLVLLDLRDVSFLDSSGLYVIIEATQHARARGGRVLIAGASERVETLFDVTGMRAHLDVLSISRFTTGEDRPGPPDNPVNARVITARVIAGSDARVWVQTSDGVIHKPWAPPSEPLPVPIGARVEVYFDAAGSVNGWREVASDYAVNQRGLERDDPPGMYADLACAGRCGLVWRAPAGRRLAERAERCLTCAGPLAVS